MPNHMKQKQSVLSVIVPVYNVEKYLDRCIKSIAGQTYTNLEIILVDDGSTDHCREICDEWSRKDTRIQVLHKKNGGLVSARKAGLKTASGQYIAYVDSDDWIEENMYERMMELMLCDHSDIVTSGLIRDYENHFVSEKEKIPAGRYEGKSLDDLKGHIINTDHFFDSRLNMHITNKIFRKSMLEKYQIPLNEYIRRCKVQIDHWKSLRDELVCDENLTHNRTHEYPSYILEALETGKTFTFAGNVMNQGLIENLPKDCCVEVTCVVDQGKIQPCVVGSLPHQLAALNMGNIGMQQLTVDAALTGKKECIYQAAMLDPHTASELTIDEIRSMVDDLIEAHGTWLPKYY